MRKAKGVLCLVSGLLLFMILSSPALAQHGGPGQEAVFTTNPDVSVDPESLEVTITCNETVADSVCITTPPSGSISAADIIFVMDVTGSMGDILSQVKSAALQIMQSITDLGINAAFGVGSFCDYPAVYESCGYLGIYGWNDEVRPDYPWRMDQDITTNTGVVAAAINALEIYWGQDPPEDWARALYETQFFTFRPNTKKIVLAFGDSPVHDCGFYSPTTYGWDPGRDNVMGTGDDLDFETVLQQLAAQGIVVLVLDGSAEELEPWRTQAQLSFNYMAAETGGSRYLLSEASEIPDAILALIGEIATIDWLSMRAEPVETYGDWAMAIPAGFAEVGPDQHRCFEVKISVPTWVPVGDYEFDLVLDADGEDAGSVHVIVHRTGASATEKTTWSQLRAKFRN